MAGLSHRAVLGEFSFAHSIMDRDIAKEEILQS
jgi:hypothetical protein